MTNMQKMRNAQALATIRKIMKDREAAKLAKAVAASKTK